MSEWKPIDTAPKNGRKVLIFCPEIRAPQGNVIYSAQIEIAHRYNEREGWLGRVFEEWPSQPTHWQPLPAPPVTD